MAVFVDRAVPGDRVIARVTRRKKSFAEARLVALVEASPDRVPPPCEYSGICGGCTWQFLRYERQLEYKRRHVAESLEHIGGIRGVTVHPTLPSARVFAYRNKMEFSFSERRWLLPEEMAAGGVDAGMALGLHVPGTFFKVLDIRACLLQPPLGNAFLNEMRAYVKHSGIPVYGLRSHQGFWRFLMLRHSVARNRWMVNVVTASADRAAVQPFADRLMARYPEVAGVVNNITAAKGGVAFGEEEIPLAGSPAITDRIGPFDFEISANSFFQTNSRGAERLYRTVKHYAGLSGRETVVDLYSGTGTIPIWIADRARSVTGIEIVESAVADAQANCRRNGVDNCRFLLGDIRRVLSEMSAAPDVMIIDPPRAGMHPEVVAQVLAMAPERIVYVSCNPATLARDLALMKAVYRPVEVQPVDLFPHTFHIESVTRLEKCN
jgi:23S rRNA (uracil1939-C5)-methyltransferase